MNGPDTLEKLLTREERSFLERHGIALSQLVDGRGLGSDERRAVMHRSKALLAFGSRCAKEGHRLRTSAGHCVMCDPKKIAFARRHHATAEVYVARSARAVLTKVGSAADPAVRIAKLNTERYGGASDWQLVERHACDAAGKVEAAVHNALRGFAVPGRYIKDGRLTDCYELFNCPPDVAVCVLRAELGAGTTTPVPTFEFRQYLDVPSGLQWRRGDRVRHPRWPDWGEGVLTADGNDDRIEVRFEKGGERILVPAAAALVRIRIDE
jgi:hypothetical protein